jgi:hypothetical protein
MMALQFRVQLIQLLAGVMDGLAGRTKNTHVLTRRREMRTFCYQGIASANFIRFLLNLNFSNWNYPLAYGARASQEDIDLHR